jgi:hypothetical protein
MKLDRAIELKSVLPMRIREIFSCAKMFHYTSKEITEKYLAMMDKYPKMPVWLVSYCMGCFDCLTEDLYRNHLIHGYEYHGTIYHNWDSYPEELKDICRRAPISELPLHGHFWKDTLSIPGEYKPYFISEKGT